MYSKVIARLQHSCLHEAAGRKSPVSASYIIPMSNDSSLTIVELGFRFPTGASPRMCPRLVSRATLDTGTTLEDHRQTGTETHAGSPHFFQFGSPRINKPYKQCRIDTEKLIVRWGPASGQASGMTNVGDSDEASWFLPRTHSSPCHGFRGVEGI